MQTVLQGLLQHICLVWVDDVVIWGKTDVKLVGRIEAVLNRLVDYGLFTAAHKAVFYREKIR